MGEGMLPLLHTWMGVHAASRTIAWFALTGLLMLTIRWCGWKG
jgi:hypothetical protein